MKHFLVVDDEFAQRVARRWEMLYDTRFRNELEVAELARDIRIVFPKGDSGDLQFLAFIKTNLKYCKKNAMLLKARSFALFDAEAWTKYGGWNGIRFLMKLNKIQLHRLTTALPGAGPYHYAAIKKRARMLGIEVESSGVGRPSKQTDHNNVVLLRQFIAKLYKSNPSLPKMPAEVRAAFTREQLLTPELGARA